MEEKLKNIENKQLEETKGILDIIKQNMFNPAMNKSFPNHYNQPMPKQPKYSFYNKPAEPKQDTVKNQDKEDDDKENK